MITGSKIEKRQRKTDGKVGGGNKERKKERNKDKLSVWMRGETA